MSRNPIQDEENMILYILENFDFEKCRKTMVGLNWTWGLDGQIPSIERLKESAYKRLKDAISVCKKGDCYKSTYFSSSGGLKGNAWKNRYGHIEAVRLEFVLTEWDSDGDY